MGGGLNPRATGRCAVALLLGLGPGAVAQELEPRAYAPSPVGITFVGVALGRSSGGLIFDPTLAITDASGTVNSAALSVGRIVSVKGRPVVAAVALPYLWGSATGTLTGVTGTVTRSGLGDVRVKVSMNLTGSPALSPRDFAKAARKPVIGASFSLAAPTGQYRNTTAINLGGNRWAVRPDVGVSIPWRRWDFDGYLSTWFFTANDDYVPGGARRTQTPIVALQGHATYNIRPRVWVAGDATWYRGGATSVNDQAPYNLLNGARFGATLALPVRTNQSLKIGYSTGFWTRSGTDFEAFAVGWQVAWVDRQRP